MTIPKNAPYKKLAVEFVRFILGQEGQEIFNSLKHPTMSPALTDNLDRVPNALKPLVREES
jgi:ABC-type Fe3+ transport system substrate-binding protein